MEQYLALARDIIDNGVDRGDRTGTGTRSVFGRQLRFDLSEGFPLLTTKKVFLRGIIHELLWFLSGSTDNNVLLENDVRIWNEWALEDGSLGSIYGKQWRSWQCPDGSTVDQIEQVIRQIQTNPNSRRLIVSAWNPADLPDEGISPQDNVRQGNMALAPCHTLFQFFVADGKLSCQLYRRSADHAIGVPFNISGYSLLLMLVADQTGYAPGEFIHTFGDVHLYHNHLNEQMIYKQLRRSPGPLPQMRILRTPESIDGYSIDDFELSGYDPHPAIKMPIAV